MDKDALNTAITFLTLITVSLVVSCIDIGDRDPISPVSTFYLSASDGVNGFELWKSDGTITGTTMVKDISPGEVHGFPPFSDKVYLSGNNYYFRAVNQEFGAELWITDGTNAGTKIVKNIGPNQFSSLDTTFAASVMNGTLYFGAYREQDGREIWKSDSTENGTNLIEDNYSGESGTGELDKFTTFGNYVYYVYKDDIHGIELWRTNGTVEGTEMFLDINTLGWYGSFPSDFQVIGSYMYFTAIDGSTGSAELWVTDGSLNNTYKIMPGLIPHAGSVEGRHYASLNDEIIFSASDPIDGTELWKSDRTIGGTSRIIDINVGSGSSYPHNFVSMGGLVYFSADDGTNGYEIWKTDGTPDGTIMIRNIDPRTWNSNFSPNGIFTVVKNNIFLVASDGINGEELWITDGTPQGTRMVRDINKNPGESSWPVRFRVVDDVLFFVADDGVHGKEWWRSDGTYTGTVMVKDICPGPCNGAWF